MVLLETLTVNLGVSVTKAVAKLWLKDEPVGEAATGDVLDILKKRFDDFEARRAAEALLKALEIEVAKRLRATLKAEFAHVSSNDLEAAVLAVAEVFRSTDMSTSLIRSDVDASRFRASLRPVAEPLLAALGGDATKVGELLLRESCAYAVSLASKLPDFQVTATQELLQRTRQLLDDLDEVLKGVDAIRRSTNLSQPESERDFEIDYRRNLTHRLDRMELFGVRLAGGGAREWPLSVAYVTLSSKRSGGAAPPGNIDSSLRGGKRVMLCGEAGSGKTTLMQWLAVRAAAADFPESLQEWNRLLPFYVRLRDYGNAAKPLPRPEQLLDAQMGNLAGEMVTGWVHRALRRGALLLVDGVDELPAARREDWLRWLTSLSDDFPECVVVVTSRPAAVTADRGSGALMVGLRRLGFEFFDLEAMGPSQVNSLVWQWHQAVGSDRGSLEERLALQADAADLLRELRDRPAVRELATNPLLCSMICALYQARLEGEVGLPSDRMRLYQVALEMLLDARDAARGISPAGISGLDKAAKQELLDGLAYWMMRSNLKEADVEDVEHQFQRQLRRLANVASEPREVLQELLERSGVIRQPSPGRVDFIHGTFLEYMAAREAMHAADHGLLVDKAREDGWRETIVFAAGHAKGNARDKLINSLLAKRFYFFNRSFEADVAAACCLETVSSNLAPNLLSRLQERARTLFPPRDSTAARLLAPAAALNPSLLLGHSNAGPAVVSACIHCASIVGGAAMLEVIRSFRDVQEPAVQTALLAAWPSFDEAEYLQGVIQQQRWSQVAHGVAAILDADTYRCMHVLASSGDALSPEKLAKTLTDFEQQRTLSLDYLSLIAAEGVAQISSLVELKVQRIEVGALELIAKLPKLRTLQSPILTDTGAQAAVRFPALETLMLSGQHIALSNKSTATLDLSPLAYSATLVELTVTSVKPKHLIVPVWPRLRKLALLDVPSIVLNEIAASVRGDGLRELDVRVVNDLHWPVLRLHGLKNLDALSLEISPTSMPTIQLELPPSLRYLRLRGFRRIGIVNGDHLERIAHLELDAVDEFAADPAFFRHPSLLRIDVVGAPTALSRSLLMAAFHRGVVVSARPGLLSADGTPT